MFENQSLLFYLKMCFLKQKQTTGNVISAASQTSLSTHPTYKDYSCTSATQSQIVTKVLVLLHTAFISQNKTSSFSIRSWTISLWYRISFNVARVFCSGGRINVGPKTVPRFSAFIKLSFSSKMILKWIKLDCHVSFGMVQPPIFLNIYVLFYTLINLSKANTCNHKINHNLW